MSHGAPPETAMVWASSHVRRFGRSSLVRVRGMVYLLAIQHSYGKSPCLTGKLTSFLWPCSIGISVYCNQTWQWKILYTWRMMEVLIGKSPISVVHFPAMFDHVWLPEGYSIWFIDFMWLFSTKGLKPPTTLFSIRKLWKSMGSPRPKNHEPTAFPTRRGHLRWTNPQRRKNDAQSCAPKRRETWSLGILARFQKAVVGEICMKCLELSELGVYSWDHL